MSKCPFNALEACARSVSANAPRSPDSSSLRAFSFESMASIWTKRALSERSFASISLACDWQTHLAYVPSESNAADWPSRGIQHRNGLARYNNREMQFDRTLRKQRFAKLDLQLRELQRKADWLHKWCARHGLLSDCAEDFPLSSGEGIH